MEMSGFALIHGFIYAKHENVPDRSANISYKQL